MSEKILTHIGSVVKKDDDGKVIVEVNRSSACAGCHEKSACGVHEEGTLAMEIAGQNHLKVGDVVEIEISRGEFYKSLLVVYIAPLVVIILSALIANAITDNQLAVAFITLGMLVPYYLLVKIVGVGQGKEHVKIKRVLPSGTKTSCNL
jgi:sigma-E factor negative regulatory protein RseC